MTDWKGYRQKLLQAIDFRSFYEQYLTLSQDNGDGQVTALCPFHDDKNPSLSINLDDGLFHCFACEASGSVIDFYARKHSLDIREASIKLGEIYRVQPPVQQNDSRPPIDPDLVEKWHRTLLDTPNVKRWVNDKKGLTDETIKRYKIGWNPDDYRNTIPIYDEHGRLVNVRRYNAKKRQTKMLNYTNGEHRYGEARLYGLDELVQAPRERPVFVCEGEWDRLVLSQHGFLAVTSTAGAGTFREEWAEYFKGRKVAICFDRDRAGREGALKVARVLAGGAEAVKIIALPEEVGEGGDVSDYFITLGRTREEFMELLDVASKYEAKAAAGDELPEPISIASLIEIDDPALVDKRISVPLTVCGETSVTFHAPKRFKVDFCADRDKGKCHHCDQEIAIPFGSKLYIEACMSTDAQVTGALRAHCCHLGKKPLVEVTAKDTVKEFFVHQKVERQSVEFDSSGKAVGNLIDGQRQELSEYKVYYRTKSYVPPRSYRVTGFVKTHPKTQQVTLLIDDMVPLADEYESFTLNSTAREHLDRIRTIGPVALIEQISKHITQVYYRDDILMAMLLTYCSPLRFEFNGRLIRGWLNTLVIGDSGTAKTQTYNLFSSYIGVGDLFSCLTGSRTGLLYGLKEHHQKGWQISIGQLPRKSRQILAVDEVQKLSSWEIDTLGQAIDEGFMKIERIATGGYETMTRLLLLANPKNEEGPGTLTMDDFLFGCQTIRTIFKSVMIVRRLDLAVFASTHDIDDYSFVNRHTAPLDGDLLEPEVLRDLVFWAWTRRAGDVVYGPEATDLTLREATRLSEKFEAADIPLVQSSDFRHKLARLATAYAALSVSTDSSFQKVLVKPDHVADIVQYLEFVYCRDNCWLDQHASIYRDQNYLNAAEYARIKEKFKQAIENEKHGNSNSADGAASLQFMLHLLMITDEIKRIELIDQMRCDQSTVARKLSILREFNLIESGRRGYRKRPKLVRFLKALQEDEDPGCLAGIWQMGSARRSAAHMTADKTEELF